MAYYEHRVRRDRDQLFCLQLNRVIKAVSLFAVRQLTNNFCHGAHGVLETPSSAIARKFIYLIGTWSWSRIRTHHVGTSPEGVLWHSLFPGIVLIIPHGWGQPVSAGTRTY